MLWTISKCLTWLGLCEFLFSRLARTNTQETTLLIFGCIFRAATWSRIPLKRTPPSLLRPAHTAVFADRSTYIAAFCFVNVTIMFWLFTLILLNWKCYFLVCFTPRTVVNELVFFLLAFVAFFVMAASFITYIPLIAEYRISLPPTQKTPRHERNLLESALHHRPFDLLHGPDHRGFFLFPPDFPELLPLFDQPAAQNPADPEHAGSLRVRIPPMGHRNVPRGGHLRAAAQLGAVPSDRVSRTGADRAAAVLRKPEGGVQSVERGDRGLDLFDMCFVRHGDVGAMRASEA